MNISLYDRIRITKESVGKLANLTEYNEDASVTILLNQLAIIEEKES